MVAGGERLSASATATYDSYGEIMKQVWVNWATCAGTAATTAGCGVADRGDRDAGAEVDQRVAVGVDHDAAAGGGGVDGHGQPDPGRDGGGLAGLELGGPRTRQGRHQTALLGQGGSTGEGLGYDGHGCGSFGLSLDAEGMPVRHCQIGQPGATLAPSGG